jgi:hypothetical protein
MDLFSFSPFTPVRIFLQAVIMGCEEALDALNYLP